LGVEHLFGVCGDVVLGFMEQVTKGPVKQINCCNELNAAYAADGYARIHGLGVVVTTFTVGPLSAINAIGGSFAEDVPVVMITGAPERRHALANQMLHHILRSEYSVARDMFRKITVACEYLDDINRIPEQIDHALRLCLYYKKPVYLELPADLVVTQCPPPTPFKFLEKHSEGAALDEACEEVYQLFSSAKNPVILVGWEIIRHNLQGPVQELIEKTGCAFCTFPTAKTALSEDHPQFLGIYQGSWSREEVKKYVEGSDLVLMLGAFLIDSDTAGFTARLDQNKLIKANFDSVSVRHHGYKNIILNEFLKKLTKKLEKKKLEPFIPASKALQSQFDYKPNPHEELKVKRFFQRIGAFLKPGDIVIADVGDSLYSTSGLLFPKNSTYIAQSFYNSIGYSVGASVGASTEQKRRTLLFVGDGCFQIGAQEIATAIHYGNQLIIFLLNNDGYGIERAIHDGPYNDLSPWRYHLIPQALGGDPGILVQTEGELESALQAAEKSNKVFFIEIKVDRFDFGDTLRRAGAAMAEGSKNSYE
jgi:TPP-dependent 2-oxoacid decarboxylase